MNYFSLPEHCYPWKPWRLSGKQDYSLWRRRTCCGIVHNWFTACHLPYSQGISFVHNADEPVVCVGRATKAECYVCYQIISMFVIKTRMIFAIYQYQYYTLSSRVARKDPFFLQLHVGSERIKLAWRYDELSEWKAHIQTTFKCH